MCAPGPVPLLWQPGKCGSCQIHSYPNESFSVYIRVSGRLDGVPLANELATRDTHRLTRQRWPRGFEREGFGVCLPCPLNLRLCEHCTYQTGLSCRFRKSHILPAWRLETRCWDMPNGLVLKELCHSMEYNLGRKYHSVVSWSSLPPESVGSVAKI